MTIIRLITLISILSSITQAITYEDFLWPTPCSSNDCSVLSNGWGQCGLFIIAYRNTDSFYRCVEYAECATAIYD